MTEPTRQARIVPSDTLRGDFIDAPEVFIPSAMRIVGDRSDTFEMFIPGPALSRPAPPTEAEIREREAERARREAAREAEMQARIDRHVALVRHHAESPVITALLTEHSPHAARWAGQTVQECHTCPDYYDDDHGANVKPEWPCPTWTTIAEQTDQHGA